MLNLMDKMSVYIMTRILARLKGTRKQRATVVRLSELMLRYHAEPSDLKEAENNGQHYWPILVSSAANIARGKTRQKAQKPMERRLAEKPTLEKILNAIF